MKYANASELLAALESDGFSVQAPIDVDRIAEMLDLEVHYDVSLNDDDITGCISLGDSGQAKIFINPVDNSYEPRRRFTLAHEIAHFCLHINEQKREFIDNRKTMSRSASYWDAYEAEANTFAAQLLMPKNLIAEVGANIARNSVSNSEIVSVHEFIQQMADSFKVSIPAMEYRLLAIGIIRRKK